MSRTYRSTNSRHGKPKYTHTRFSKLQIAHCHEQPEPYTNKRSLYETVTHSYEVPAEDKDRIWVSKGTPMAKPEFIWVEEPLRLLGGKIEFYMVQKETGRYFILPKPTIETITRRRYLGPNPDYDWDESSRIWEQQRAFNHVRKNQTGYGDREKKHRCKQLRLSGKSLTYEAKLDFEYMQNCVYEDDFDQLIYYWNEHPQGSDEDHIDYFDDDWNQDYEWDSRDYYVGMDDDYSWHDYDYDFDYL